MEKFYYKSFMINGEKFTFVPSHRTPLKSHKNDVDLCNTQLTIPYEEMEAAIKELQENGRYKDFIVSEYIAGRDRKEAEWMQKNIEYWNGIRKENEQKAEIMKEVIEDIKTYCKCKEEIVCLVYNKLEDCIKDGYFVVYTYSGHKTIRLADVGIMEYTKRIA